MHHIHTICHQFDLFQVGGDKQHSHILCGDAAQQLVDIITGRDIHAARRLIDNQYLRRSFQAFGNEDFLLDDYDSRGVTASVEGGYTFEAGTFSGSEGTQNTWYVQPQAQITWMGVKDSDHTRKDGTRIETEGDGNVQTRLGVKTYLNSHHQRDDGKQREFQPYIEANWINNSKVYAVKMNGQTVGREGARNLGEVRTGVEAKVNNNLSLWGNVGVQRGDKGYSDTQGMLGVKYSW